MRKLTVITALLAVVVALPAVAPAKNNPGVVRTGVCSGLGANWKLKAKHDDGASKRSSRSTRTATVAAGTS
ncbi:MAG TPA: hypothetical protein VKA24_01235 [Gaiellaceae bacterium]|nr:hypothetical protein [Gaiellaceae bacterium]